MPNRNEFERELRRALNHFYDPGFLQRSPLLQWLHIREPDPVEGLRALLRQAIEAFRPPMGAPQATRERRVYDVLYHRYLRRLTQQAEADRLGITVRHLRREQAAALEALADYLGLQFDLFTEPAQKASVACTLPPAGPGDAELNREMLWLADSQRHRTCQVAPVLREAVELAQGLASDHHVALQIECDGCAAEAAIPGTVLRQIVLNLLTAAIRNLAQGGAVRVTAREGEGRLVVSVTATACAREPWRQMEPLDAALLVSRQLAELFGGQLTLCELDEMLVVQVVVPRSQRQVVVLAVEDNAETLRLWSRYVRGTPFQLVQEIDPTNALARAMELRPQLIVLDVMMPDIDGWALLKQLREEPLTSRIPIIVCTVLPQRDLALSLGASDFIQKPTTGQEFRAALERQISVAMPS
ncbi:MAG: response regulator [Chloroflexi bacterium]|nr:response regulator [Chloroflexota bacterium]